MFDLARFAIVIPVRRFLRDEGGATAIEYAMIASGIAVAIVAVIVSLSANVQGLFNSVATAMN